MMQDVYLVVENQESQWPKRYRSEFIEPGIISYEDIKAGKIYIGPEAIDKMASTFIGKPVINEAHRDMTPEQAFKIGNENLQSMADGVVYNVGKMPNGWYFADMIIWDQETQKNIENGYSVSCAYVVDDVGPSGSYHGIDYNEEVVGGHFTHQAIVQHPRYERAKIYELSNEVMNSLADKAEALYTKGENKMAIFKFLNSKEVKNETIKDAPKPEEKENEMELENAYIMVDGQKIPLADAIAAYKAGQGEDEGVLTETDTVDIDGQQVSVADLIAALLAKKENAELPQDVKAEEVVENRKVANSHFTKIKTAVQKEEMPKVQVDTKISRYQRGSENYGSK